MLRMYSRIYSALAEISIFNPKGKQMSLPLGVFNAYKDILIGILYIRSMYI